MSGRGLVWLLLTTVGLAALVAYEVERAARGNQRIEALASASSGSVTPPALPDLALRELLTLTETTSRPLFNVDRRAPVIDALEEEIEALGDEPSPQTELRLSLSAVVIAGERELAYLTQPGGGLTRLQLGEFLDGWQLTEVRPDSVVLVNGEQRNELELRRFELPPQPTLKASDLRDLTDEDEEDWEDDALLDDEAELRRPRRPKRGPRQEALKRALRRAAQMERQTQ